jgi:hypothetical protein
LATRDRCFWDAPAPSLLAWAAITSKGDRWKEPHVTLQSTTLASPSAIASKKVRQRCTLKQQPLVSNYSSPIHFRPAGPVDQRQTVSDLTRLLFKPHHNPLLWHLCVTETTPVPASPPGVPSPVPVSRQHVDSAARYFDIGLDSQIGNLIHFRICHQPQLLSRRIGVFRLSRLASRIPDRSIWWAASSSFLIAALEHNKNTPRQKNNTQSRTPRRPHQRHGLSPHLRLLKLPVTGSRQSLA